MVAPFIVRGCGSPVVFQNGFAALPKWFRGPHSSGGLIPRGLSVSDASRFGDLDPKPCGPPLMR